MFPASRFWDFTMGVYGRPGVSPACIALQDSLGLDVNLLLFCCWVAASGRGALSSQEMRRCRDSSEPWQAHVVGALRGVRRRLKDGVEGVPADLAADYRKRVLALEIDGEHVAQVALESVAPEVADSSRPPAQRRRDAAANLAVYLGLGGASPSPVQLDHLGTILAAAFPDADRAAVGALLGEVFPRG